MYETLCSLHHLLCFPINIIALTSFSPIPHRYLELSLLSQSILLAMDAFTPQQTIELVSRIGCKKSHMRLDKLWWNSFMSGPLLGFGCAVALSTEAAPWYQANAPGLIRTIGALFFPIGLVMIVLSGADLFTSNIMFMTTAFLHRRITIVDLMINWVVSFLGNLAGMLFFMAIITGCKSFGKTPGSLNTLLTDDIQMAESSKSKRTEWKSSISQQ